MKERILYIVSLVAMSLMVLSCTAEFDDDITLSGGDEYITLKFTTPGVETRGEVADNDYESYLSHLDVVVYEYSGGAYTPFHYQRVDVSATPDGSVTIAKSKRDFKESVPYRFYVIANSTQCNVNKLSYKFSRNSLGQVINRHVIPEWNSFNVRLVLGC